jgi:hypothetical protein
MTFKSLSLDSSKRIAT